MTIACIPSISVEYVKAPVTGTYTELMMVQMAVMPSSIDPTDDDWLTAQWDDGYAKVKVGAGSDVGVLDRGLYGVWVKIAATDETPVLYSGSVRIT